MTSVSDRAAARRVTPLRPTCAQPHACSRDVRLAVLHRTPFFSDLNAEEIAEVASQAGLVVRSLTDDLQNQRRFATLQKV